MGAARYLTRSRFLEVCGTPDTKHGDACSLDGCRKGREQAAMTSLRNLLMAVATLLIAGCASSGYGGGYDGGYGGGYGQYPQQGYYGYDPYGYSPYYGGGYAYGYDDDDFDHDSRRYFHPEDGVT